MLALSGCSLIKSHSRQVAQKETPLPPLELLQSNYEQAPFVVLLKVTDKEIEQTIFADDGSPGYIITRESGTVLESFKGDLQIGEKVVFHDWLEYHPGWQKERGKSLLVFLKPDPNTPDLKTIAEAAVFNYHPELIKMIKMIRSKTLARESTKQSESPTSPPQIKTQQK